MSSNNLLLLRSRCGPRLEENAAEKLKNKYVLMRNSNREIEEEGEKRLAIPITVRQLEAIVRISESLAKMELKPFATDAHVDEAIRIFQVGIQNILGISGLINFSMTLFRKGSQKMSKNCIHTKWMVPNHDVMMISQ